ncbi:MAG: hypothetical protein M1453_15035 [Acidobacteria bacterium]|nr:hypothetical protein [Acidobacteriota bacterium]MCL5289296.1 hypothetical protein [Acidobacteriota bacterium]
MLGFSDYALWIGGTLVCCYIIVLAIVRGHFRRYFALHLYVLANILNTAGGLFVLRWFGFTSVEYRYFYYAADALLAILLYFVVIGFFFAVLAERKIAQHLPRIAGILLVATAVVSYLMVEDATAHLAARLAAELSRNLNVVGFLLIWLLGAALWKMRETRTRIIQLVLAMFFFFSAYAVHYVFRHFAPELPFLRWSPPILGVLLFASWAYTFTFVTEEARATFFRRSE